MINPERLLQRFLRYVSVDTMAVENAATYPSSPGQIELGQLILRELKEIGLTDATQSRHGIVLATVPSTVSRTAPTIAFNSHLDTSPETTATGVHPQVTRNYTGGDLVLPGHPHRTIRVSDNPELESLIGSTLVTTDGTTLLGGDDKAGVAAIMELATHLMETSDLPHGPVKILFTCDEEIGEGVSHVDVEDIGALVAYTLDGPGAGSLDTETFSADLAVVTVSGANIHPAIAKDRMINAIKGAAEFVSRLPRTILAPERSSGREGFLHPYHIDGGVAAVTVRIILRDFETPALTHYRTLLEDAARNVMEMFPGLSITVQCSPQYRNMRDGLARDPRAVQFVHEAYRRLGRPVRESFIRGGTDGSQFTEMGLPTPNLSTGQHNPHSPLEWVCLEEMVEAVQVMTELVQVWSEAEEA